MVPQLRSVHRYKGIAFPDLAGSRVVVVIADPPEPEISGESEPRPGVIAVYSIEDGEHLSEFAYAVAAEDLDALDQAWSGVLPFPRVVLHARGDATA